jgi:hypothetical protein
MTGDWDNFLAKMQSTGLSPDALRGVFDQLHEMLTAPAPVAKGKGKGKKGGNKRKSKKTKKCSGNRRARKTRKIYKRHR